jgi:hypothetical protein
MSQKMLFQQSPNPSFRSTINQKRKILQPVRKPNQLSNVPQKPSALKTACEKPTLWNTFAQQNHKDAT